jgi:hypothetical protein
VHFWEVVPLEVLLQLLAADTSPTGTSLSHKLHRILVPSYLPNAEDGVVRGVVLYHCVG